MTSTATSQPVPDSPRRRRVVDKGDLLRANFVYVALLALIIFFSLASPYFLSVANFSNIGRQTAIVSIGAVGMAFVIISAQIDLSIGSVFALSGLTSAYVMQQVSNQWWLGLLAALVVGVVFGVVNGLTTIALRVPSFLVTLGTLGVARGLALLLTDTRPVLVTNATYFKNFGDGAFLGIPVSVVWTLLVVAAGAVLLHRTTFGLTVFASGGNRTAATYTGIDTRRATVTSFAILGLCVGLAATVFTATAHAARPDLGVGLELDVIAAVILGGVSLFGGKGTILGALVGSILIGIVNNGLVLVGVDSSVQLIIKGLIIVAAVSLSRK